MFSAGIGGSYMCIYPMDSPGGYQLVGRTLPIWNTFGRTGPFTAHKPWLLEFFDQVGAHRQGLAFGHTSSANPCIMLVAGSRITCVQLRSKIEYMELSGAAVLCACISSSPVDSKRSPGPVPQCQPSVCLLTCTVWPSNTSACTSAECVVHEVFLWLSVVCVCAQVRFFEVSEGELEDLRERFRSGQYDIDIEHKTFSMAEYNIMLECESRGHHGQHDAVFVSSVQVAFSGGPVASWFRAQCMNFCLTCGYSHQPCSQGS